MNITTRAKNDYRGCKVGEYVQVEGKAGEGAHLLQIANDIATAERFSGRKARIVPGRAGKLVRIRTYSESAGYLWGRPTGEHFVEVEIV